MDRKTLDQLNNTLINPNGIEGKIKAENHREFNKALADYAEDVADEAKNDMISGIKGVATQTNAPTAGAEFEIWKVAAPLTLPNSWGFAVSAEELKDNFVFFNVINGAVEKEMSEKKSGYGLSQVIDPNNTDDAVVGKAVYDFVKENINGVETVLEGFLDVPSPGRVKPLEYTTNRGFLYLNNSIQNYELSEYLFVQNIEIPNYSLKLKLKRLPNGLATVLGISIKDGILTGVKDLTPNSVSVGAYFEIEVLKSEYSFVSFSLPYSDVTANVLDVGTTYPETNILNYLNKNYLTSDEYVKREEGKALQKNANPIYISYGTDAFKKDNDLYNTYTTDFIEAKAGDTLRATIAYQGNALEVYDIKGVKLEELFNADNLEKREIEYTFKENGKFKLKNASAKFLPPSFYIARKLIILSLNASNLVYHSEGYNKFVFNVRAGDVVNFKTLTPAETNAVDFRRNGVLVTGGLKGGSEPHEGSFIADGNYEVTVYVLKEYLDPWVNVYTPITKKYYLTPDDVNLDQFDQFLNNKGAEVIRFDLSDFNVTTTSGAGEWKKTTDFIEAKAGDTLQAGVYNYGYALQIFDENEVLLQELFSGDGDIQKREFKHVFDQDRKFKVISMLAVNGDPYATLTLGSSENSVKAYTEADLVDHNKGIKKWVINVKAGDTIQYRTYGYFNTLDVLVSGVLLYYTNQANGAYSTFTTKFNHEAQLVIYCQERFSDVWVNVYTPITKKYYLTPDDVQDLKATLTEVGNAFDLPKPESLLRLDLTTTSELPTAKGTVINGEAAIRSAGVAFKKFVTIEVQGSSSAAYPKKNWTLVFFNDEANTSKFNLAVNNSIFINEWVYKANFIDATHTRNIGANRLWKKIELSRAGYPKRDIEKMYPALGVNAADTRATGTVNGYPCELYINGNFYGIGTFNLGKKRDNYNLDNSNANHIQVETGSTQMDFYNMTLAAGNYEYRSPKTITAAVEQKVADFKAFAAMPQAQFNTRLPQIMDVTNLVDYFIFVQIMYLPDNLGNNIMLTRWSDKFFFMPYDLDNSFGLEWNGSTIHPSNLNPFDNKPDLPGNTVEFWHKVKISLSLQIAARYQQLKTDGIITEDAVYTILKEMEIKIGQANYKKEAARWTIPSASITSISQIMAWYKARLVWCDSYLLN